MLPEIEEIAQEYRKPKKAMWIIEKQYYTRGPYLVKTLGFAEFEKFKDALKLAKSLIPEIMKKEDYDEVGYRRIRINYCLFAFSKLNERCKMTLVIKLAENLV